MVAKGNAGRQVALPLVLWALAAGSSLSAGRGGGGGGTRKREDWRMRRAQSGGRGCRVGST
jgi:hypothetical protein